MKEFILILAIFGCFAYGLWPLALVLILLYLWF